MTAPVRRNAITDREGRDWAPSEGEIGRLALAAEETRKLFLDTVYRYGRGHCGPCLSQMEILATLYFAELRLDPARFTRIHRTHIVNLDQVATFRRHGKGGMVAELRDGTRLAVSRARAQALRGRGV